MLNLESIPILDHHAHAVFHEAHWRSTPLEPYFTESYDPAQLLHTPYNLFYQRSIRALASFYQCDANAAALLEARQGWDYLELNRAFFKAANIERVLIDDGIWVDRLWSVQECADYLPIPVQRVVRIESELALEVQNADSAKVLLERVESRLRDAMTSAVSLKSIIAYRTGLEIARHTPVALETAFADFKRTTPSSLRVDRKPLLDAALLIGLRVAHETGKPIQFHTGYGDPDLDLRLANPLHLRPIFEDKNLRGVNVVMLHCYPFLREAGYLAASYPGAYLDLGLTIPHASTQGMLSAAREAMHLAPLTKVLFSTDAQRSAELFWLTAGQGRRVLGMVLGEAIIDGDLTPAQAQWAAERVLRGNAAELYADATNHS